MRRAACLIVRHRAGEVDVEHPRPLVRRSRSTSRASEPMPALAKAMSRRPKRSTAASARRLDVVLDGHVAADRGDGVAELVRDRARAPSSSRSPTTTRAPSATNRRVVARPMPEAPPVTRATLPASRPGLECASVMGCGGQSSVLLPALPPTGRRPRSPRSWPERRRRRRSARSPVRVGVRCRRGAAAGRRTACRRPR